MGIFDRQIASAQRLIDRNGKLVDWVKLVTPNNEDNDDTPWETITPDEPTATPVKIVFLPNTGATRRSLQTLPDTQIPTCSTLGYMAAQSFDPAVDDVVYKEPGQPDTRLTIEAIDTIVPNGDAILHIVYFAD